jgi:hypothetical protein
MSLSADIITNLLALPPGDRYELAQQLLDSIDANESEQLEHQILSELLQRRDEMMRGEQIVDDWRRSLAEIERSLTK